MSSANTPTIPACVHEFVDIWAQATSSVLESLRSTPYKAAMQGADSANSVAAEGISARFKTSGALAGELVFEFSRPHGIVLAQLLMMEPPDTSAAFNEGHADAINEIFRQFAGVAATVCKSKFGGDVQFQLESGTAADWKATWQESYSFTPAEGTAIVWKLAVDAAIAESIEKALAKKNDSASAPANAAASPTTSDSEKTATSSSSYVAGNSAPPANLELLLDVELNASLR